MMLASMKKGAPGCAFFEKVQPINASLDADLLLESVNDTLAG